MLVKRRYSNLQFIREEGRTEKVCLAAVQADACALGYIPWARRTPEMCLAAVTQGGWALRIVPKHLKTPEICLAAISRYPDAIQWR